MHQSHFAAHTVSFLALISAVARADPAPTKRPTTLPAFTHTLTLVTVDGYGKGKQPSHYCLVLPDDWRTTGASGTWRIDSDDDAESATLIHNLSIKHLADGTLELNLLPGVLDVVWYVDLKIGANDVAPFQGHWTSAAAFGPNNRPTSSEGTATIALPRHPTTKPK